jgi:hypothetical protein
MDKDLERFIKICNLKMRLKDAVKNLGFENKNGVLFVKPYGFYDTNIKFDDTEFIIWNTENPNRKISRYYSIVLKDVNNGIYKEQEFVESLLKLLYERD